jgi:hypothetical protein
MKIKLEITDATGEEFFANADIEGAELLPPETMLQIIELTIPEMWKALKDELLEAMV